LKGLVARHNDMWISLATHGLLDHVDVTSEGPMVKVHLTATRDQIATIVNLVATFLHVAPPPGNPAPSARP
jgi:hypothetical protein